MRIEALAFFVRASFFYLYGMTRSTALILALGMILSGIAIGYGFMSSRKLDRYVTVKGLSEREVLADMAIWPIGFTETSNDIVGLQQDLDRVTSQVVQFLKSAGFSEDEISVGVPSIVDIQAQNYFNPNNSNRFRYIGKGKLTVRSTNIERCMETMSQLTRLIGQGVVIDQDDYNNKIQFLYTSLNDIKPEMIEAATKNARDAAEKFARDSGSEVGKIRRANQGFFSIVDRDRNTSHIKTVRVVNTIEFLLE